MIDMIDRNLCNSLFALLGLIRTTFLLLSQKYIIYLFVVLEKAAQSSFSRAFLFPELFELLGAIH